MSYDINQATNGQVGGGAGPGNTPGMHHQTQHMQHMHHTQQLHHYNQGPPVPQSIPAGVLYCNKHDSVINTFCMQHQVPLCQTCVREHLHHQSQTNHYDQTRTGQSAATCDLLPIEQAINESLHRMQSWLASVQDFIEFKKTLNDFPDEATLQMYLQQNQVFDNAYSMAHRYFINLQNLPDGQKELHLAQVNTSFFEEYKRFTQAKSVIEVITKRMQHLLSVQQNNAPTQTSQNPRQQSSPARTNNQHAAFEDQIEPQYLEQQQQQYLQASSFMTQPQSQHKQVIQHHQSKQDMYNSGAIYKNPMQIGGQTLPYQHQAVVAPSSNHQQYYQQIHGHSQIPQQQSQAITLSSHQNNPYDPNSNQIAVGCSASDKPSQIATIQAQSNQAQQQNTFQQQQNDDLSQQQAQASQYQQQKKGNVTNIQPQKVRGGDVYQENPQARNQQAVNRTNHRGLRLTVKIDLQIQQQLNFEIEVDPVQSLKQLQQNIKDDVAKLEPNCTQAQLEKLQIYLSPSANDQSKEEKYFDLIPQQIWGGSLIDCGLREGCVILFSSRILPTRQQQPQSNKPFKENPPGIRRETSPAVLPSATNTTYKPTPQSATSLQPASTGSPPRMTNQGLIPAVQSTSRDLVYNELNKMGQPILSKQSSLTNLTQVKKTKSLKDKLPSTKQANDLQTKPGGANIKKQDTSKTERAKKPGNKKEQKTTPIFYKLYKTNQTQNIDDPESVNVEKNQADDQYQRSVESTDKTRVKNLKQLILEDLNLKDTCAIRLYQNSEPLLSDMDFIKDLNIDKVEAELFYQIQIQVEGMGGQYQRSIEVSPGDSLDQIRQKVPFFTLFSQRNYTLVTDGGVTIERDQLKSLPFRDSGLRNGSRLFMRPPQRERGDENVVSQEEEDEGMINHGEGGEDELLEMEGGEEEMIDEGSSVQHDEE